MGFMVIDDSSTMRKIVGTALKSGNYDYAEAENGKDALSKLTGQKIDCFIVDFNMPEMNGIEFIANAWLVKPFEKDKLLDVVGKLVV